MRAGALIVTYRVVQPVGMQQQTFLRLKSHFDILGLADRYRRMGFEHLGGLYPALRRAYGVRMSAIRVADKLIEGAEDLEETNGLNHWLAKLYRALASDATFCDGGFEVVRVQTLPQ